MGITSDIFLTHDNPFSFRIMKGRTPVDLISTGVTRMVIKYGDDLTDILDSAVLGSGVGQPFDWVTDGGSGIVKFDLGECSISSGTYLCKLVIFDPTHIAGQVFKNTFILNVNSRVV